MSTTRLKKILIFSLDYYPGEVGGAEIAIKQITDRIDPAAYTFHLITLRYDTSMSKTEQIGNVLVHRIGFGWKHPSIEDRKKFPLHLNKHLFQITAALKAWRLHRKYSYDGVWGMMAHSCGVPSAIFKMLHPTVKFVLTLQEGDPPKYIEKKMRLAWPIFSRAFTKADQIQTISSFLASWAKERGYRGNPIVVPNAVNVAHFAQAYIDAELLETRKEIGRKEDDTLLVTTSRMVYKNGLDMVIDALPDLPSHIHFLIYGGGPDKEKLEEQAKTLGVSDRVHFKGLIGHADMPRVLQACDIFIRPSRSEGMGNSFVEAMAARLPVIATQEGGIADFLFDPEKDTSYPPTGFAVRVEHPEDIAMSVKKIIDNSELVATITQNASELVREKYDWDIVASRMQVEVFDPLFV